MTAGTLQLLEQKKKREILQKFIEATKVDVAVATHHLEMFEYDLKEALAEYQAMSKGKEKAKEEPQSPTQSHPIQNKGNVYSTSSSPQVLQ